MENDAVVDESADTREFKILLDLPSTSPALGFEDYAAALAEIIQKSARSSPSGSSAAGARARRP